MFDRTILRSLRDWASSPYRKSLLLRGARQVGKTTAVRMFASEFDTFIELNLEQSADRELFEKDTDVANLFNRILIRKGVINKTSRILLFIDEIQNSPEAIKALRYFYEQMPELYVIAAGSLLEIYLLHSRIGLAVGRVENLWMYPLDFAEFLSAAGQTPLLKLMNQIPCEEYAIKEPETLVYAICPDWRYAGSGKGISGNQRHHRGEKDTAQYPDYLSG